MKDCGTSTDQPPGDGPSKAPHTQTCRAVTRRETSTCERIRYHTDVRLEPTEEIYLTPVQRCTEAPEPERPSVLPLPPISSDSEPPPPYRSPFHEQVISSFRDHEDELQPPPYSSCVEALAARDPDGGRDAEDLCYRDCGAGEAPHESLSGALMHSGILSNSDTSGLSYDSVKYTLVVDEHDQLELVSLRDCYHGYSDDSDTATVYDNCVSTPYERDYDEGRNRDEVSTCPSESSTPDGPFSRKFVNVFMNGCSRSSSTCRVHRRKYNCGAFS